LGCGAETDNVAAWIDFLILSYLKEGIGNSEEIGDAQNQSDDKSATQPHHLLELQSE
jgi:hypothetical protein